MSAIIERILVILYHIHVSIRSAIARQMEKERKLRMIERKNLRRTKSGFADRRMRTLFHKWFGTSEIQN